MIGIFIFMNDPILIASEKWFAELQVETFARPTCLLVNRQQLENLGTAKEILDELRGVLNSKRVYWGLNGVLDEKWLYLQAF